MPSDANPDGKPQLGRSASLIEGVSTPPWRAQTPPIGSSGAERELHQHGVLCGRQTVVLANGETGPPLGHSCACMRGS
jgi:hypothetical protein